MKHPLSVNITTKDTVAQREVQHNYVLQTRHPRWELFKIFLHVLLHARFR